GAQLRARFDHDLERSAPEGGCTTSRVSPDSAHAVARLTHNPSTSTTAPCRVRRSSLLTSVTTHPPGARFNDGQRSFHCLHRGALLGLEQEQGRPANKNPPNRGALLKLMA